MLFAWSFDTLSWPQALVLVTAIVVVGAVLRALVRMPWP